MGDNSRAAIGSQYAATLATRLARMAPGDLDVVHLCNTASEAVEVALTIAQRAQGLRRSGVVYAARSPYGGTEGTLPDSMRYRWPLRRIRGDVRVPFGDAGALADALRKRRIGTVILEPVQSGAGVDPPRPGYLREVRRLCDEHEALWIADEVRSRVGQTGRFFAFEHAGVVPDLVALAKSLGGAAAAVSAVIARGPVHRRGGGDDASATGLGTCRGTAEACRAALETLAVLDDEDLVGNAERTGRYLLRRLEGLRQCYPNLVTDVRGMGLMVGVQLAGITSMVGALLLAEHGVLVAFTDHDRDVLRLEPPLTVRPEHVDHFVDALDELLSRGPQRLARDYLRVAHPSRPGSLSRCGPNR